jgi:hypothetical protein
VTAAAAHFERGLWLARGLLGAKSQLLELLLAFAEALRRTERPRDALDAFKEAAALAREFGSAEQLAQAALGVEETERFTGGERAAVELLEAAVHALGSDETVTRCRVLSRLGRALPYTGEIDGAAAMSQTAIELARRLGDPSALFEALSCERSAHAASLPYRAPQFAEIRAASTK